MRTRVDSRHLRRHVVRVERADDRAVLGTGFFVAPGWVLTAAHVVHDAAEGVALGRVMVVPADAGVGVEAVPADVLARSAPPVDTALWPYPDLALLRLRRTAAWVDTHPCVWLAGVQPQAGQCHAYGFPPREEGAVPVGAPASFVFEGVTGDEFFQLKAGQAAPGLSGAPLVCPTRRAVVGVVTATRDRDSDLGGWAAPVAALLSGGPGVPEDLTAYGEQVAAAGAAAVLADRAGWHAVLPVDGADDLVEQPWTDARVQPGTGQPSTMLRPEFAVVDYLFRDGILATVRDWCDRPERLSMRYIEAGGGAGKTRFAVEACRAQRARGWVAGLLPADDSGVDRLPVPRLLVVDYVEERDAVVLAARLAALTRSASPLAPVRVLLLGRPSATALAGQALAPLAEVATGATLSALDSAVDTSTAVADLTGPQRDTLFTAGLTAFGRTWNGPSWAAPRVEVDLSDPRYSHPLDVLLEAFDAALSGPDWRSGQRPPVDRALDHEARRWYYRMPDLDQPTVRLCVALSTLAGARDDAEATALLDLVADATSAPVRARIDRWLRDLYDGPDRWNPLRPDRLGEALVARVLGEHDDKGLTLLSGVLAMRSDAQVERVLDVLIRLAGTPSVADVAAVALAGSYTGLVRRCAGRARSTDQSSPAVHQPSQGVRVSLLDGLCRAHTALLTADRVAGLPLVVQTELSVTGDALGALARDHGRSADARSILTTCLAVNQRRHELEPDDTGYARDLSVSYNRLGDLARDSGQSETARQLYHQALTIAEQLATAEPDNTTYASDLSISYERLGDLARDSGQSETARQLYHQASTIRERLATAEPDNTTYAGDLSISYNKLGDLARDSGQSETARQLYHQALTIAERLTATEPDNTTYARDLSISYNKLGDLARDSGQSETARQLYHQALTIAERLTATEPDNTTYARDLSISYNKLGDLARDSGQSETARQLYHQALTIAERLTATEPDNTTYARDLSISYNNLGDLARASGQSETAQQLYHQALTIRERLATAEPDNTTYARNLSISYNRLGDLARDSGQSETAQQLYHQTLTIAERLTATEPDNTTYARDLSISYNKLGDLAHASGQSETAQQLYHQALTIAERLTATEPDNTTYARDLSISYNKLGDLAHASGQSETAQQLYHQALTIAERLTTAEPDNTTYARDLSISYNKLGDLAHASGQSETAQQLYHQALTIAERLTTAEPDNTTYARDLSISYERLGDLARDSGQAETAQQLYHQSSAIRERLATAEPDNTTYARNLSISYNKLGDLAHASGQSETAQQLYHQALTIAERLTATEPDNTTYARDLSVSYNRLGDLARDSGQSETARQLYQQTMTIAERLTTAEPDNTTYARDLSISYERLGDLARQAEDTETAKRLLTMATLIRRALHRQEPNRVDLAEELGVTLTQLSSVFNDDDQVALTTEIVELLEPFERAGTTTPKGAAVLHWARR
ncbi:tetratricopeptide repeat protein [Micromonospora sp. WMMD998]|uniref:tetratricopeptide repeat protein n=1 Tax=Micromonospora sp. WMMD998 TaxID=3016092 RepID=UPI00249A4DD1|nr:tetratricopeptide repeat protein [Micromonospora sp. WMMD998]WFE41206.1 tetratricopeptide repeat protein [Micromonospora sp. WMMD998]